MRLRPAEAWVACFLRQGLGIFGTAISWGQRGAGIIRDLRVPVQFKGKGRDGQGGKYIEKQGEVRFLDFPSH